LGYVSDASTQTPEAILGMRITDIALPVLTALGAIWVMWKYSLSEERARQIKAELVERRGEL